MQTTEKRQKGYKGMGMEGMVARWYAGIRRSGSQIEDWRKQAAHLTGDLPDGADVLEVAPGPGYFAIEMATARQAPRNRAGYQPHVRGNRQRECPAGGSERGLSARQRVQHAFCRRVLRSDHLSGCLQELQPAGQGDRRDVPGFAWRGNGGHPGHVERCLRCDDSRKR